MQAAVLGQTAPAQERPLILEERPIPQPGPGEVLLRVRACGVCRTDLHIVEGELPPLRTEIIPGHQVVGDVVASRDGSLREGQRVGVSWLGGTDGTCSYCREDRENLCDAPVYTGYSRNGGYAEYVTARPAFCVVLSDRLDDLQAAPLLCAGVIGFRSLRRAEVKPGQRVGLWGFGASAHLAISVLKSWNCKVYVSTRGASHQAMARRLGADWIGDATEMPPEAVHAAVTFAPSGDVVLAALRSLRKGGIVAINAIHLDRMPQFDYDKYLWGERELRSVANMTREDARDFLAVAAEIQLKPEAHPYRLDQANEALLAVKQDAIDGAAVLIPS
jgi:propanol-preferring alcohol dehydrogenase